MKNTSITLICMAIAATLTGCAANSQTAPAPLCLEGVSRTQIMKTAERTLQGMSFQLEKYDTDAGFIRTSPLRAGQIFEPWRSDNSTAYDTAEANLQSLQRVAELHFTNRDTGVCVECSVQVKRLSMPPEPICGMARAAGIYNNSNRTRQSLYLEPDQSEKMEWVDMDNDHDLEAGILNKIKRQVQKGR